MLYFGNKNAEFLFFLLDYWNIIATVQCPFQFAKYFEKLVNYKSLCFVYKLLVEETCLYEWNLFKCLYFGQCLEGLIQDNVFLSDIHILPVELFHMMLMLPMSWLCVWTCL